MSWGGVKKQANIENIKFWCDEMDIKNYTITPHGEINVDGNVYLFNKTFEKLPYKFGKVKGFFDISSNQNLTSLKNCPDKVDGYFSCSFCDVLDSLEGCPKEVKGNFWCRVCKREFTKEDVTSLCKVEMYIWC